MRDIALLAALALAVVAAFALPSVRERLAFRRETGQGFLPVPRKAGRAAAEDVVEDADPAPWESPRLPAADGDAPATPASAVAQAPALDVQAVTHLAEHAHDLVERQLLVVERARGAAGAPLPPEALLALESLALQTRRAVDSLTILAGSPAHHPAPGTVALRAVVRSAAYATDAHDRVDLVLEEDVQVSGSIADAVGQLLAELMETLVIESAGRVVVKCDRARDGVEMTLAIEGPDSSTVLSDEDLDRATRCLSGQGLGIHNADDLAFTVAGRIARAAGLAVRLGRDWDGGVLATVPIPARLLQATERVPVAAASDPAAAVVATPPTRPAPVGVDLGVPAAPVPSAVPAQAAHPATADGVIADSEPAGSPDAGEELWAEDEDDDETPGRNRPNRKRRRGPRKRRGDDAVESEETGPSAPAAVPGRSMDVLPGRPLVAASAPRARPDGEGAERRAGTGVQPGAAPTPQVGGAAALADAAFGFRPVAAHNGEPAAPAASASPQPATASFAPEPQQPHRGSSPRGGGHDPGLPADQREEGDELPAGPPQQAAFALHRPGEDMPPFGTPLPTAADAPASPAFATSAQPAGPPLESFPAQRDEQDRAGGGGTAAPDGAPQTSAEDDEASTPAASRNAALHELSNLFGSTDTNRG